MTTTNTTTPDFTDMIKVVGTFTKKDGTIRTMTFRCNPTTIVVGLQERSMKIVWDTEKDGWRRFNFGKQIGRVVVV